MTDTSTFPQIETKYPLRFLAAAITLYFVYFALPAWLIEDYVVRWFAVIPSGLALDFITPYDITTESTRILSPVVKLNVLKGCEGTEILLLIYSAIFAAWRPLNRALYAAIVFTLLIFFLNQIRIACLFYVAGYHKTLFDLVHGYLAPLLIVIIVGCAFSAWIKSTKSAEGLR